MGNYIASARTNYVRVKDPHALKEWASRRGLEIITQPAPDGTTYYGVMETAGEGWPSDDFDGASGEYIDVDLFAEAQELLEDGQVMVFMEVGYEKMRYLVGQAVAVTPGKPAQVISLCDIYPRAAEAFNVPEGEITRAEY